VLRELEDLAIEEALKRSGGSIPRAAKLLGIGRATLYRRVLSRAGEGDDEGGGGAPG
jgi:transcriptional regulator of acetoin/glycerol metabolism